MDLTCKQCGARFRATIPEPLTRAVRVACPSCSNQMVLKPAADAARAGPRPAAVSIPEAPRDPEPPAPVRTARRRLAVIADEPRPFRSFLAEHLHPLGFDVTVFETGEPAFDFVRRTRADLAIVNVYLKGRLGVEVTEDIRADPALGHTRVILIGALFRANRFRANPTNLYGADEYIEEQIPEKEFRQIIRKLFPEVGHTEELPVEPKEYDEARRLARLILSDIVIYITWYPSNQYAPISAELGAADFDVRHRLNLLGTVAAGRWGNLGVSGRFASGLPYSETAGIDLFHTGMANARPAGVGRNTLRASGFSAVDLRWSHDVRLTEAKGEKGRELTLSVDAFNIFNHPNFAGYVGNLRSPFYLSPTTVSPGRRLQLSAEVKFGG